MTCALIARPLAAAQRDCKHRRMRTLSQLCALARITRVSYHVPDFPDGHFQAWFPPALPRTTTPFGVFPQVISRIAALSARPRLVTSPAGESTGETTIAHSLFLSEGSLSLSATATVNPMVTEAGPDRQYIGCDPGAPQSEEQSFTSTSSEGAFALPAHRSRSPCRPAGPPRSPTHAGWPSPAARNAERTPPTPKFSEQTAKHHTRSLDGSQTAEVRGRRGKGGGGSRGRKGRGPRVWRGRAGAAQRDAGTFPLTRGDVCPDESTEQVIVASSSPMSGVSGSVVLDRDRLCDFGSELERDDEADRPSKKHCMKLCAAARGLRRHHPATIHDGFAEAHARRRDRLQRECGDASSRGYPR